MSFRDNMKAIGETCRQGVVRLIDLVFHPITSLISPFGAYDKERTAFYLQHELDSSHQPKPITNPSVFSGPTRRKRMGSLMGSSIGLTLFFLALFLAPATFGLSSLGLGALIGVGYAATWAGSMIGCHPQRVAHFLLLPFASLYHLLTDDFRTQTRSYFGAGPKFATTFALVGILLYIGLMLFFTPAATSAIGVFLFSPASHWVALGVGYAFATAGAVFGALCNGLSTIRLTALKPADKLALVPKVAALGILGTGYPKPKWDNRPVDTIDHTPIGYTHSHSGHQDDDSAEGPQPSVSSSCSQGSRSILDEYDTSDPNLEPRDFQDSFGPSDSYTIHPEEGDYWQGKEQISDGYAQLSRSPSATFGGRRRGSEVDLPDPLPTDQAGECLVM